MQSPFIVRTPDGYRLLSIPTYRSLYVSKNGDDANSGRTLLEALLTIGAAMTAAAALTPTAADPVVVYIEGPGVYVENVTGVQFVHIFGPEAEVQGTVLVTNEFHVCLHAVTIDGAGTIGVHYPAAAPAGVSYVSLTHLDANDTSIGALCEGANNFLVLSVRRITVENGFGVGDLSVGGTGHIQFDVSDINLTGAATPVGIARGGVGGVTVGRVTHIDNVGASGTAQAIRVFGGQIDMTAALIETPVLFQVDAGATLALSVGDMTNGTRTVAATGILQLSEAKRDNMTAVVAPAVGDDYADGYRVGSLWFDSVLSNMYVCVNPAAGAAVWEQVS